MRGLPATLRWGAYFTIALGLHAAGAAALLARWNDSNDLAANAPVIMIDLAPVAVAPQATPSEKPPAPVESKQQIAPEPTPETPPEVTEAPPEPTPEKPVGKIDVKPEPVAEPELTLLPPPKPPREKPVENPVEKKHVKKKRHRIASLASAPSAADRKAERAAAPTPGAAARNPNALPDWRSRLSAHLKRNARALPRTESLDNRITVHLAFHVDRRGGIHSARIKRSSGNAAFDHAALAMLRAAAPLPAPPPEIRDTDLNIDLPVRYNSR